MEKNVDGQIVRVWAWKAGQPYTGGAATITMQISKDAGALANSNDTNPTELDDGAYYFDLTQAETNCNLFIGIPACSDNDVIIYPVIIYTGQGLLRGTSGQYIGFLLWDGANDEAKTGDASNLTIYTSMDSAALSSISVTISEIGSGVYVFQPTAAHIMCDNLLVVPISSTSGVYARPIEISLNRPRETLPIAVTVDSSPISVDVEANPVEVAVAVDDIAVAVSAGQLEVASVINSVNVSVDVEDFFMKVVFGPTSSTDNALVRFDGTTGKVVQDSNITLSDLDVMDFGGGEIEISAGTLTLANDQIGWVKISKTGSSLADLETRSAADLSSGYLAVARMPNSGTWTFNGTIDISGGTLTLAADQVAWVSVNKTGSSLADLSTRSAGDLSSGNLAVARMPSSGTWSFTGTIDISSGTLTLANDQVGWAKVDKTGSSIADLETKNHTDLTAGDGSDHTYIDQDVTNGSSPTFGDLTVDSLIFGSGGIYESAGGTSYVKFIGDGGTTLYAYLHEGEVSGEPFYQWVFDTSPPA